MATKKGKRTEHIGLQRWFGDLEVIDAKERLRIQPNEEDIKNAVRNDPTQCVFSQACKRMWSSTAVVFFGTIAYVDLLDKNGVRHVERFKIPKEGKEFIRNFDKGRRIAPKGFVILPPSQSETLDAKNKAHALRRARQRKALIKGVTVGAPRPQRKPTGMRLSIFRNGMGMAQFPATGKKVA